MKRLSLLIPILLCASITFAQVQKGKKKIEKFKKGHTVKVEPAKVPQAVKDAQTKQFPNVQKVKWKLKVIKKKDKPLKDFIAVFKGNDGIVKAHYKPDGTPLVVINHYKADKIPSDVASNATNNYPGFTLKHGSKVKLLTKNKTFYRLVMTKTAAKLILLTDERGNDAQKVNDIKEAIGEGDSNEESDYSDTE